MVILWSLAILVIDSLLKFSEVCPHPPNGYQSILGNYTNSFSKNREQDSPAPGTLIEPCAVVVHAVEKAKEIFNFKQNSYVLVQGCGPIGLLLLTTVRTMGVRNIIAVDGDENRLNMAKKLGAAYTINFLKEDANAKVLEITDTGAEMAFQCTGSPKAASTIWSYVRRGGSMCELGLFVAGIKDMFEYLIMTFVFG